MASIRKNNGSVASQPVKAGEATPANITPHVTFEASLAVATQKIDALLRGGVECITYISSSFLIGYLSRAALKQKLSVMRDEFALALNKQGLGGTQTKKYLDYAFKLSGEMFKECQYGMEVAALIAADTPDKAHDAVKAWLTRHTNGKKTEHGYLLTSATEKLNVLGIFLKFEDDPSKPETLPGMTPEQSAQKRQEDTRKRQATAINKDPSVLQQVSTQTLVDTVSKVVSFDVLVIKHIEKETKVAQLEKEFEAIAKAFKARIAELKKEMGAPKNKKARRASNETVAKAA
jgi:hypothetical protein